MAVLFTPCSFFTLAIYKGAKECNQLPDEKDEVDTNIVLLWQYIIFGVEAMSWLYRACCIK
jgi:hypothetical protein